MYHEKQKGGLSLFGAVLIVLVAAGIIVYLLPKKDAGVVPVEQNTSTVNTNNTDQNVTPVSGTDDSQDIESDLNSFDTTTTDVNLDSISL